MNINIGPVESSSPVVEMKQKKKHYDNLFAQSST